MSIPPSERGISNNPENPEIKQKPIQELTREDMKLIAEKTEGKFIDNSRVYDFEIGSVAYRSGQYDIVELTLRKGTRDEIVLWLKGPGINAIFPNSCTANLGEKDLTVQKPTDSSPILAIEPGKITFNIKTNQRLT